MRLSEKTIELNFCHQFGKYAIPNLVWFGLTQKQESIAGFDACTQMGGKLLIFQFKASSYTLRNGCRRFHAPHDQMVNLRKRCHDTRGVYYVFPLIGTTHEIVATPDLLSECWFLDVADLPETIPEPKSRHGTTRKSGVHYVDVKPHQATIHSDPFQVSLINSEKMLRTFEISTHGNAGITFRDVRDFLEMRASLMHHSVAVIVPPLSADTNKVDDTEQTSATEGTTHHHSSTAVHPVASNTPFPRRKRALSFN